MKVSAPFVIVVVVYISVCYYRYVFKCMYACVCMCVLAHMFMSEIERG